MQTVKKGIKRVAALAGTALMLGSSIAAPALSANLSDFPGLFVKDGELKATIVVGKVAATADVVGGINVAAAMAQATHKKATISGGGAGSAKLSKTAVSGVIHEFALAAKGAGTGDEKTDICFGDFKKGFIEDTATGLEGLHDYHGLPFLQDVVVAPSYKTDDKFRIYDIIDFETAAVTNLGFGIDKEKLSFDVPQNVLAYKIFFEVPADEDYDGDGTTGNDNLDAYANSTSKNFGVDNYLTFNMFGQEVRLTEFDTHSLKSFTVLVGEKKVIQKGKTTEFKGFKISLNDVASGSNTAFFEIIDPNGASSIFSANYDNVHDGKTFDKKVGDLNIAVKPDCYNTYSTAEVWLGIGDIDRVISSSNKKWKDVQNKETYWEFQNICCEDKAGTMKGSTGCSSAFSGTNDLGTSGTGQTCVIEYNYNEDRSGNEKGLKKDQYIEAPTGKWKLQFHGLNVMESGMDDLKVVWDDESVPYDKKGEYSKSMEGYKIVKPEGATMLLENKKPVGEIFVAMPKDAFTAATVNGGLGCTAGAGKHQITGDKDGWPETDDNEPPRPDTGCVFILYKDEGAAEYKFYKVLEDFAGTQWKCLTDPNLNTNMPAAACADNGAAAEDGKEVRLLAKMYHGSAVYQLGITKVESKNTSPITTDKDAPDEGTLYLASEEEGKAKVQFVMTFDFANDKDDPGLQDIYLYHGDAGSGRVTTSFTTQEVDQNGDYGIIAKTPKVSMDNNAQTFKVAKADIRGLVSLNSGVTTEAKTLKKGDVVGEYTVADIIPDVPSGNYYTYTNIAAPVAMLDSEVSDPTAATYGDFILVGGPSANELVAKLGYTKWDFCDDADQALPCDAPIALIELKEDAFKAGKKALVAAGWEAIHTRAACYILQHYYDYADRLSGSRLKFKTVASASLPIEAADLSFS